MNKDEAKAPPWCLYCEGSLYEDDVLVVDIKMPSSEERYTYHFHCLPSVARIPGTPAIDQRAILDLYDRLSQARRRKARG